MDLGGNLAVSKVHTWMVAIAIVSGRILDMFWTYSEDRPNRTSWWIIFFSLISPQLKSNQGWCMVWIGSTVSKEMPVTEM